VPAWNQQQVPRSYIPRVVPPHEQTFVLSQITGPRLRARSPAAKLERLGKSNRKRKVKRYMCVCVCVLRRPGGERRGAQDQGKRCAGSLRAREGRRYYFICSQQNDSANAKVSRDIEVWRIPPYAMAFSRAVSARLISDTRCSRSGTHPRSIKEGDDKGDAYLDRDLVSVPKFSESETNISPRKRRHPSAIRRWKGVHDERGRVPSARL